MATIPTDWAAIRELIRARIAASTGLTTIWRDQDAPAPSLSPGYVSLKLLAPPQPIGRADVTTLDTGPATALRRIEGDCEFTISVQIHQRSGAELAGARLKHDLEDEDFRLPLTAENIAWTGESITTDLAQISGAQWEGRAAVDLRFRVRFRVDRENVDWIETSGPAATTISPEHLIEGTIGLEA